MIKGMLAIFINSSIANDSENYEHAFNKVTGCFTEDSNKCYLDMFQTSFSV